MEYSNDEFFFKRRQLLSIARALLKQARVVILDEATASIDFATDMLIQDTIAQELKQSTVLTVAHRINTILSSNRILVMKDGNVAEFDSPCESFFFFFFSFSFVCVSDHMGKKNNRV